MDGTSSSQVVERISFFSRREGDATAFCDLQRHRMHDVVLGRNEAALEGYWHRLPGKERVRLVCMDLSSSYRALVRKHFPNARMVADRFHGIRVINVHFAACWRQLDPRGARHRGMVRLMPLRTEPHGRAAPTLVGLTRSGARRGRIYDFKQRLCAAAQIL